MRLKELFKKNAGISKIQNKAEAPEGIILKCKKCGSIVFAEEVKAGLDVCPSCGAYFRMTARRRLAEVMDANTFCEWDTEIENKNPLEYKGYEDKIKQLQEKTKMDEAIITGKGKIAGHEVAVGAMDCRFLMASMGYVVGEKITRMVEMATKLELPVILFCCSGGARMQEGMTSLMQMAKTSGALKRHHDKGLLYISVLTNPTTGGVTASFAMLGDIILAEPKALIGFAGPRVIEQTIGQKLPKGFQSSEFLLEHGMLDGIVERKNMAETLGDILSLHCTPKEYPDIRLEGAEPKKKTEHYTRKITAWEHVELSRKKERPVGEDYIHTMFSKFVPLHGDRMGKEDEAVLGGLAYFHGIPVTVIAQSKGHDTKENISRNFAMPSPEGYRKSLRLMKEAEKFKRPILLFVDTPGAFCGMEAEEHGQGEAIARNLFEMMELKVPVLSIVIGEGGSGGALAFAVANEVWMLENAVYSILSPEGYASILWKDSSRAKEAAKIMKMTAKDLKKMGMVEKTFKEPKDYTLQNITAVTKPLEQAIYDFLLEKKSWSGEQLCEARYQRFRKM